MVGCVVVREDAVGVRRVRGEEAVDSASGGTCVDSIPELHDLAGVDMPKGGLGAADTQQSGVVVGSDIVDLQPKVCSSRTLGMRRTMAEVVILAALLALLLVLLC